MYVGIISGKPIILYKFGPVIRGGWEGFQGNCKVKCPEVYQIFHVFMAVWSEGFITRSQDIHCIVNVNTRSFCSRLCPLHETLSCVQTLFLQISNCMSVLRSILKWICAGFFVFQSRSWGWQPYQGFCRPSVVDIIVTLISYICIFKLIYRNI